MRFATLTITCLSSISGHSLPYEHYSINVGWSLLSYLSMAKTSICGAEHRDSGLARQQCPDLNPIEHVWNLLKNGVANRRPFIKGRAELEHAWMDEWDKLDIEKDINPFILN